MVLNPGHSGFLGAQPVLRTALTEYLRMKRKEKLLALRGKVDTAPDWQSLRQAELEEGESLCRAC